MSARIRFVTRDYERIEMPTVGQNRMTGFGVTDSHYDRCEVLVALNIELVGAHVQHDLRRMALR